MVYRSYQRRTVIFLWITIVTIIGVSTVVSSSQQQQQQSEDEVCDAVTSTGSVVCMSSCHHDTHRCTLPSTIYESSSSSSSTRSGKTAMAYVPNIASTTLQTATTATSTTSSNMVCDTTSEYLKALPYRVATWPLSRSTIRNVAPILQIQINLFTCQLSQSSTVESSGSSSTSSSHSIWSYLYSSKKKKMESATTTTGTSMTNKCCCQPYQLTEDIEIELWQTRPDGTYPSLLSAYQDGNTECRARYIISPLTTPNNDSSSSNNKQNNYTSTMITSSSSFVFHTFAPGSTGVMNGLGPKQWDIPPYGPPVIHMMIHTKSKSSQSSNNDNHHHHTLFIDVPILISKTTLESTKFYGSDYRGPAWVATKSSSYHHRRTTHQESYQITQWEPQPEQNLVRIAMDVFIPQPHHDDDDSRTTTTRKSLSRMKILCPSSYWYGFPTSFFIEPIAVCAPSLLDFFHL